MNRSDIVKDEVQRFVVSFIFEQSPRHGVWKASQKTLKDMEAWVRRAFYQETGGVSSRAMGIKVLPLSHVICNLCGKLSVGNTAHLHQEKWIGDECCWDERLRSTE